VKTAFSEIRINQLPISEINELRKLLLQLFALTGLRNENFPDQIQTDILINFIREDLGNYTISEIRLAFRMAIKNELDIESNHYQAFSASYVARIMSAYVPVRSRHLNAARANENALKIDSNMQQEPAEKQEVKKAYVEECILKPWRYYLKKGTLTFGITPFSIIYDTLVNDLQIIEVEKERKKEVYEIAKEKVRQYINRPLTNMDEYRKQSLIKDRVEKQGFEVAMDYEIKSHCYEMVVMEFFKNAYASKIDLESIITNKLTLNTI
tara:strand:+ start:3492 stop:4292 length:801 start_codon:yes stop_codon:yes gene_type:complete